MGGQIAICHPFIESHKESRKDDVDGVHPENLRRFEINCAFHGFHVIYGKQRLVEG